MYKKEDEGSSYMCGQVVIWMTVEDSILTVCFLMQWQWDAGCGGGTEDNWSIVMLNNTV